MDSNFRDERVEASLELVDESKHEILRALVHGGTFSDPVVSSFAIDGLTVAPALAGAGNLTCS